MATTIAPSIQKPSSMSGKSQRRQVKLRPRVKGVMSAQTKENQPDQTYFPTAIGTLRVPRRIIPLRPDASMITNVRQGVMSKFLRLGRVIAASDLDAMVDPKTAIIHLTDTIELETDHLSDEEEQMPESQKSSKNLYYVSLRKDELPSYHFWASAGDPDPTNAPKEIDWGQSLKSARVSAQEAAILTDHHRARQKQLSELATKAQLRTPPAVRNDWTEGGIYYRESNPKRDAQLPCGSSYQTNSNPQWQSRGSLFGLSYSGDHSRIQELGNFYLQPGDPEWEIIESDWEQKLEKKGLENVMADLERDHPEKYRELTYGKKSFKIRPARGDDDYARQFNEVLKTAISTVSFKLTQQEMGRPISPLNSQEPLTRNNDPKGWNLRGKDALRFDASYEILHHKEEELEFLDFYNKRSHGEPLLRRRKPIPEEHIHRQLVGPCATLLYGPATQLSVHGFRAKGDSSSGKARVLIQGRKGALNVQDLSFQNFCASANRLVSREKLKQSAPKIKSFLVFTRPKGDRTRVNLRRFELTVASDEPKYISDVLPELQKPDVEVYVSRDEVDFKNSFDHEIRSNMLKVNTPLGYFFTDIDWSQRNTPVELSANSHIFIHGAVYCLCPPEDGKPDVRKFGIHVPGYPDSSLNLSSTPVVDAFLQKIFSQVTGYEGKKAVTKDPPVNVFLYEQGPEPLYRLERAADNLRVFYTPPLPLSTFISAIKKLFPSYDTSADWRFLFMNGDVAWNDGSKSITFDENGVGTSCVVKTITKNGAQVKEIQRIQETVLDETKWDSMKVGFKLKETIRLIRCFVSNNRSFKNGKLLTMQCDKDNIRVYDGRDLTRPFCDWDTREIYGSRFKFDSDRVLAEMAATSEQVLGINPLHGGPGIKILENRINQSEQQWLYLNDKISAIDFLHEFIRLRDGEIHIYPFDFVSRPILFLAKQHADKAGNVEQNVNLPKLQKQPSTTFDLATSNALAKQLLDINVHGRSRLDPESIYHNAHGKTTLPRYGPSLEFEISGGPDLPSLYPRVLGYWETQQLQHRTRRLENEILQREHSCRVCEMRFPAGSFDIREHYREHKLRQLCPYCQEDWTDKTRQYQLAHIASKHESSRPKTPRICAHQGCSIDLNTLSNTQIFEHEKTHAPTQGSQSDEHGRPQKLQGQGWFCSVCMANLTSQGLARQQVHTKKCGITIDTLLVLGIEAAKKLKDDRAAKGQKTGSRKRKATSNPQKGNSPKKQRLAP